MGPLWTNESKLLILETVKIELLKPCVVAGHPGAQVGDILEVTPNIYQILEGLGAARLVTGGVTTRPAVIETRDPEPDNRDPETHEEPAKRRGRKKTEDGG